MEDKYFVGFRLFFDIIVIYKIMVYEVLEIKIWGFLLRGFEIIWVWYFVYYK